MPNPLSVQQYLDIAKIGAQAIGSIGAAGLVIYAAKTNRKFSDLVSKNLVFPSDLERFGISMAFDFMEYKRRSIFNQPFLNPVGRVRLPVAANLRDNTDIDWEQVANGPIVGATLESSLGYIQSPTQDSEANRKLTFDDVIGGAAAGASIAAAQKTAKDIGTDLNQLLQPTGLATNPFLTVLFKQPKFKTHSFTWTMVARDPAEAGTIADIVNTFKYHSLPDVARGTAGTLLNYPNICQPRFYSGDKFLYQFKPCAISSVSVNKAPSGPSFFYGVSNAPSEVELSIELLEIEYWTKVDFDRANAYRDENATMTNF